jgi:hypothetical protein
MYQENSYCPSKSSPNLPLAASPNLPFVDVGVGLEDHHPVGIGLAQPKELHDLQVLIVLSKEEGSQPILFAISGCKNGRVKVLKRSSFQYLSASFYLRTSASFALSCDSGPEELGSSGLTPALQPFFVSISLSPQPSSLPCTSLF